MTDRPAELLADGRVRVRSLDPTGDRLEATVEGRTGVYRVARVGTAWACACPSWRWRATCSHVDAVRRIVQEPTA